MYFILFSLLLVLFNQDVVCIIFGNTTYQGKRYVVYLLRSPYAAKHEDNWMCAGSIVSPSQILTAAACLVEMQRVYVIAGYSKLVRESDLDEDQCTKNRKQRIVKMVLPKDYKFTDKPQEWMIMDVAVGIVEKPYDFNDVSYKLVCSYPPGPINILMTRDIELDDIHATVYGWGHYFQAPRLYIDWESGFQLQGGATRVRLDHGQCNNVMNFTNFVKIMRYKILCGVRQSKLDTDGRFRYKTFRRASNDDTIKMKNSSKSVTLVRKKRQPKDPGPCEGDHGGPLITWVGAHEVLIGISMTNYGRINSACQYPFFYTSTVAIAHVIKCLLITDNELREKCNEKNFGAVEKVVEVTIDWSPAIAQRMSNHTEESIESDEILDDETIIKKYRERILGLNDSVLLSYLKKQSN